MSPRNLSDEVNIAVIAANVANIKEGVRDIKTKLEQDYITKEAFEPIKKLVYGLVSLILIAVVGALMKLVLLK